MTERGFPDNVKTLIEEFSRSGIRELHVRRGDFELYLSTEAASARLRAAPPVAPAAVAPAPASGPPVTQGTGVRKTVPVAAAPAQPDLPADAVIITAPNLGTFYRAPKPGAANYVEIGSKVTAGDELCLIEVMKLFTALRAEVSGTIHAVLVEDGEMVDGGQPLFALVRD